MAAFPSTQWSRVVAAGDGDRASVDLLCRAYWQPLYLFARRSGADQQSAQDLVQGFLSHFIERNDFTRVSPERGRFRTYLLHAFRNFQSNDRARNAAQKRGGGAEHLVWEDVEVLYRDDMDRSPEVEFERQWARHLVGRARQRVREAYAGRPELLDALFPMIAHGELDESYAEVGRRLEMTEGAVKVAAFRFRRRFADALRAEVAATVADDAEVDDELAHLIASLG